MSNLNEFFSLNRKLPLAIFGKRLLDFTKDELKSVVLSCLTEESIVLPLLNREEGHVEFLSEVLRSTSKDILDIYCNIINDIFTEAVEQVYANGQWSVMEISLVTNAIKLSNLMKRGIGKDSLVNFVIKSQNGELAQAPADLLKRAAFLISIYPFQDSAFWVSIDIKKFPSLIAPCINGLAGYPDACMDFIKTIPASEIKPNLRFPLSKFVMNIFKSTVNDDTKRSIYRKFYYLNNALQDEINTIIQLCFKKDDQIFKLIGPITFWKSYVRERSYVNGMQDNVFAPISKFYDTSIFPFGIQKLGINKKYNFKTQVFPLGNYVDDAPWLLNGDLESALKAINLPAKYQFLAGNFKKGNVLITYPIEAFTDNQSDEGMHIAVLNLFNYAIVSNIEPSPSICEELLNKNADVPTLALFSATLLQLINQSTDKKFISLYVNDAGIEKVMEGSFEKLLAYLKKHFDARLNFKFKFIVVKSQKKLIEQVQKPNSLVITTGPVLAEIFERQVKSATHLELFSNSIFINELLNTEKQTEGLKKLVSSLSASLLHQSLNINIPIEEYRNNKEFQRIIHKFAKLSYFTSNYIKENIEQYVDFVENNYRLFKLSGSQPSRRSIKRAILFSYQFGDISELYFSNLQSKASKENHFEVYERVIGAWDQALKRISMSLVMPREKATHPEVIADLDFLQAVLTEVISFGKEDYLLSAIEPHDLEMLFKNHLTDTMDNSSSNIVANA